MKKTLALLVASTALTVAIGVPAWSAMRVPQDDAKPQPIAALFDDGQEALPLIFVSDDDDDDDDDREDRRSSRYGDDDDDDDDDREDDDDDDASGGALNPAPAGTVAPPQNGLFGNGAPPQIQVK
ncbi:hypothetical protein [Propylenella binzhouense]|uniref:Uncharacterized protein n=1 Tax=Propylenella binzhouense TaxID=2555902 RepID=A0A964T1Y1_9HYPH|nr:hypothetical protein [Propylenella binzhouense]MYZ46765.1 hypothetical protein [Propylenella binzhouense]